MAIAEASAPRFEIRRVIGRVFSVIGSNLITFGILSFVAIIPFLAVAWGSAELNQGFLREGQFDSRGALFLILSWFVYLLSTFLLQAMIVHAAVLHLNGGPASRWDCLATGLSSIPQLALMALLLFVAVFAGALFLVVPAFVLMMMWFVAVPACVVERTGVLGAFSRSRELTRGYRWLIFGLYFAYFILAIAIGLALGALTGTNPFEPTVFTGSGVATVQLLVSIISTVITSTIYSTLIAAVYYELRQIKEGVGPEALARVFD